MPSEVFPRETDQCDKVPSPSIKKRNDSMRKIMFRFTKSFFSFVIWLIIVVVVFESFASLELFTNEIVFNSHSGVPLRIHVQHDEELGWINIPGLHMPDMYGFE